MGDFQGQQTPCLEQKCLQNLPVVLRYSPCSLRHKRRVILSLTQEPYLLLSFEKTTCRPVLDMGSYLGWQDSELHSK